jgi:hypothetical protein
VSQAFPLDYERPTFAIGVAWPNAKDYRYEMQSDPSRSAGAWESHKR